jgi:hypothetical protein
LTQVGGSAAILASTPLLYAAWHRRQTLVEGALAASTHLAVATMQLPEPARGGASWGW